MNSSTCLKNLDKASFSAGVASSLLALLASLYCGYIASLKADWPLSQAKTTLCIFQSLTMFLMSAMNLQTGSLSLQWYKLNIEFRVSNKSTFFVTVL